MKNCKQCKRWNTTGWWDVVRREAVSLLKWVFSYKSMSQSICMFLYYNLPAVTLMTQFTVVPNFMDHAFILYSIPILLNPIFSSVHSCYSNGNPSQLCHSTSWPRTSVENLAVLSEWKDGVLSLSLSLPLITGQSIGICEVMYTEEGRLQGMIKESWLGINRWPNWGPQYQKAKNMERKTHKDEHGSHEPVVCLAAGT